MQELIYIFIVNIMDEFTFFLMFYLSMHKEVNIKKIIVATLCIALVGTITMNPINEFCNWLSQTYHISSGMVVNICNLLLNLPVLYYLLPKNFKSSVFHGACCYYIWQACIFLYSSMMFMIDFVSEQTSTTWNISHIVTLIPFIVLAVYLIKKMKIFEFAQYLRIDEKPFWQVCLISFSILSIFFFIDMLRYLRDIGSVYFLSLAFLLLAISSIAMRITSDYIHNQEKEVLQDTLFSQQTLYIQNLEYIQQEMRLFKHDYQNMLSGIYLHSQNGDSTEVQKTIQNLWDDFDEGIGIKMHMTNQLANIKIMEVKGLLMKKLTEIHEKQIEFYLEVLYPITNVHMKTNDLTRCLGILLDNAMEEVSQYGGHITCMMVQEQKETTFVIENTIAHPLEIECIWDSGYSTKGEHRGLGLESYQKIVDKYENVTMSTTYENQVFIQELRIGVMI